MQVKEVIAKKRDGGELNDEELRALVQGFTNKEIPEYQIAAWLMAVYWRGMTAKETSTLTELMWKSGTTFPRNSRNDYWIDKHSTGGVGDKPSLIIVPLVTAVCQRRFGKGVAKIPMISGRGLGHSGGTLDKLESVPGFSPAVSIPRALSLLSEQDFFMMGQTADLAPADRVLYALRDVTATVESIPLIVASIMSKKLSENLNGIVFDVKFGAGAFMPSLSRARELADALRKVAVLRGLDAIALLTAMEEPLGFAEGNALEVEESAEYLCGIKREKGLDEVVLSLAAGMVHLASRKTLSLSQAREACVSELSTDRPFAIFKRMFESQGGNWEQFSRSREAARERLLSYAYVAPEDGVLVGVNAHAFGTLLGELGGGRRAKEDNVDFEVGMRFMRKVGEAVKSGQEIVRVYFRNEGQREIVKRALSSAISVRQTQVSPAPPWVVEVLS